MPASSGTTMDPRTVTEGAARLQSLSDITWLDLSRSVIEYKETKLLAMALVNNELPNLKVLFLEGNSGDVGMRAMLNALSAGHLKRLEKFILWEVSSYNQITTAEEGTDTIAAALMAGNLPRLDTMDFTGSLPKLIPARKLSEAIKQVLWERSCGNGRFLEGLKVCMGCLFCTTSAEKNQTLECLRCLCGRLHAYSGDDGMRKIERALNLTPIDSLRFLRLQHNHIGDEGASSLAQLLRRGKLPHLEELDLRNNPVGYKGALKMVLAYLRNPLLTVRLKLDWLTVLLQEKAASLRDSNVRLEYKLKKLKIPDDSVVIDQFIKFDYQLKRHPGEGCCRSNSHKLHLMCQAQHGGGHFTSHQVVTEETLEPMGIEIRNRSSFGLSSRQKTVQRDLEVVLSGNESHESPVVSHIEVQRSILPLHTGHSPSMPQRDPNAGPDGRPVLDEGALSELPSPRPSTSSRTEKKRKIVGVNRIYITSISRAFVGAAQALAAEALGNQSEGRDSQQKRRWLPEWIHQKFRQHEYWPWQSREKTKRQMDSIMLELLMLGERKPNEFYSLFGLRQVLLQNRSYSDKYSRVWICKSCFSGYCETQVVHPITIHDEFSASHYNS